MRIENTSSAESLYLSDSYRWKGILFCFCSNKRTKVKKEWNLKLFSWLKILNFPLL